jgi:hypothetical protein
MHHENSTKESGWPHVIKLLSQKVADIRDFANNNKMCYRSLWALNQIKEKERKNFLYFCEVNKLSHEGGVLLLYNSLKAVIKKALMLVVP